MRGLGKILLVVAILAVLGEAIPFRTAPSFMEIGNCASLSLMDGFDENRYLGQWYPQWNVPNTYVDAESCAVDTVTIAGKKLKVVTKGLTADGDPAITEGKLAPITPKNKKKKPFLQLQAAMTPPVPYYVVDTDYTSYSCVYSCYSLLGLKAELFWVYSRTPEASPEIEQKCFSLFAEKKLDMCRMRRVNQENCNHPTVESEAVLSEEEQTEEDPPKITVIEDVGSDHSDEVIREEQIPSGDDEDALEGSGDMPYEEDTEAFPKSPYSHICRSPQDTKDIFSSKEKVAIKEESVELVLVELAEIDGMANREHGQDSDSEKFRNSSSSSTSSTSFIIMSVVSLILLLHSE